jgi:hypothetical protein
MSPSAEGPTVVCVLGMSRTGTSLTTRVLNLAGVFLGAEEELLQKELRQLSGADDSSLARARETNPEGFWEHYRIMRLNERILKAFGGNWRDPPEPPSGWELSEKLGAEREEAHALLAENFLGHRLWGWKDPRNCLTLPFWQRLIPDMRYVICLRNPLDVAASLQRRDQMPLERAFELWLIYVARALVNSSGGPRLFVTYESYFEDPRGTAARLAAFAGRDGALDGVDAERELSEAVVERLWRHRTPTRDVVSDGRVPEDVASLHLLTELLAATTSKGLMATDDGAALQAAVDLYAENLLDSGH